MLAETAILNHAYKQRPFPLTWLHEEDVYAGFHHQLAMYADIVARTSGKVLLNFDDYAFNLDMRRFLEERFSEPCAYERQA